MIEFTDIIQFGFAGVALLMLYSINYNHLMTIQTTLVDIKTLLAKLVENS